MPSLLPSSWFYLLFLPPALTPSLPNSTLPPQMEPLYIGTSTHPPEPAPGPQSSSFTAATSKPAPQTAHRNPSPADATSLPQASLHSRPNTGSHPTGHCNEACGRSEEHTSELQSHSFISYA